MCQFSTESNKKSVSGYKVAIYNNGKFYSPVTGIEYSIGNIPIPKRYGKYSIRDLIHIVNVLDKKECAHDSKYKGLTAVFKNKKDAIRLCDTWERNSGYKYSISVIKLKLSGKLYEGKYGHDQVYLGSTIESIN